MSKNKKNINTPIENKAIGVSGSEMKSQSVEIENKSIVFLKDWFGRLGYLRIGDKIAINKLTQNEIENLKKLNFVKEVKE